MIKGYSSTNKKIGQGVLWNIGSYFFLSIFTVVIYTLIVQKYGQAQLGNYNIVLSIYMLVGQIGSWGLQSTSIYYVTKLQEKKDEFSACFSSFVQIALSVGILLGIAMYLGADLIGRYIFRGGCVSIGIRRIAPAIVLFSVNKVICSFINGLKQMRTYAVLLTVRYMVITVFVGMVVVCNLQFENIFFAFIIAEIIVMIIAVLVLAPHVKVAFPRKVYLVEGLTFGTKAVFGNVVGDINTRIDTMMIGIICSEKEVGLYSFVTLISEGFIALLNVFRSNFNPFFSSLLHEGKIKKIEDEYRQLKQKLPIFFCVVGALVIGGYALFSVLFLDAAYMRSVHAVVYIVIAYIVMAPYFTCGNLCTLKGRPLVDTLIMIGTVLVNVVLNLVLISVFDIVGAALATAGANIIYVFVMRGCINKYVLFTNVEEF